MKLISIALFIVGLLLECAAFFGDQAANIPLVMKIVAPKYVNAQAGMQTLVTKKTLEPDDTGFSEIAELFRARLRSPSNPEAVSRVTINRITRENARFRIGLNSVGERIPIGVVLSNGQKLEQNISVLRKDIETLQNTNLFRYTVAVFFLGVIIQCVAFIIKYRENKGRTRGPKQSQNFRPNQAFEAMS